MDVKRTEIKSGLFGCAAFAAALALAGCCTVDSARYKRRECAVDRTMDRSVLAKVASDRQESPELRLKAVKKLGDKSQTGDRRQDVKDSVFPGLLEHRSQCLPSDREQDIELRVVGAHQRLRLGRKLLEPPLPGVLAEDLTAGGRDAA